MKKSVILLTTALTLAACNKPETTVPTADHNNLYAQIEQEADTKTYMDASNNIRWSSGDQVVAFMKTSLGLKYQIKDEYVGKASGYFSQVSSDLSTDLGAGTEWDHNVVYYPYSDAVEAEKSGSNYILDVVLPSEQTYAPESFGEGSMAMVAVSEDNNITFRNVLGGMKLQLKGTQTVTSVTLQGNNNEKLSGAATVSAYTDGTKPTIIMSDNAIPYVTLNCAKGVQLNEQTATEFIISLPPVKFSDGFNVLITDIDGRTSELKSDKQNEVLRSSLLSMPEVSLEFPIVPVESISLNSDNVIMYIKETLELSVSISPDNASDKRVVWESNDESVVTVNNGNVYAVGVGEAEITVKTLEGNHSAKCTVTVKDDPNIDNFVITTGDVSDLHSLYGKLYASYTGFSGIIGKAFKFGICYSDSSSSPNENDMSGFVSAQTDGTYSINVELSPSTLYYFRAIVYYDGRYFYGDIKSFTTPSLPIKHQAIDLGLSVKWSPCNLGAETTDMNGDYYAWGEVHTKGGKENYGRVHYEYYDSVGKTYINIGEDISGTKYDAALTVLGSPWRMPTYNEVKELYEKCDWKAASYNNKSGYLVTGPNGNSIFIVTVSCTDTGSSKMKHSQFWTSTLSDIDCAYYLNYDYFKINAYMAQEAFREYGLPVRPVCN